MASYERQDTGKHMAYASALALGQEMLLPCVPIHWRRRLQKQARTGSVVRVGWSDQSWYPWRDATSSEHRFKMEAKWAHSAILFSYCCSNGLRVGIQTAGKPIELGHTVTFGDTERGESHISGETENIQSSRGNHAWWYLINTSPYKANETKWHMRIPELWLKLFFSHDKFLYAILALKNVFFHIHYVKNTSKQQLKSNI